jgi:hypothetical protein
VQCYDTWFSIKIIDLFNKVSIVASYIKERTKNAQFIVISLRNNMFELASRLVGVYKVNHMVGLHHFASHILHTIFANRSNRRKALQLKIRIILTEAHRRLWAFEYELAFGGLLSWYAFWEGRIEWERADLHRIKG